MYPLQSIEGLLFRIYISRNNVSLLHKCIQANQEDVTTPGFFKASMAVSNTDFHHKLSDAKRHTEQALKLFHDQGIQCIPYFHKSYPSSLLSTRNFPPLLFVKGLLPKGQNMAIVGSRHCSPLAYEKTSAVARQCAEKKLGIISGLALGIDTLAHKAALINDLYTAAILPASLDNIYPPQNSQLSKNILERGGALISEQPPFMESIAHPFVLRNRIIAALSDYIFPVEMKKDSGTRHALQYAVRYKKTVILCLPGATEIDWHLLYYEGILTAIAHYKKQKYAQLTIIKDIAEISGHLAKRSIDQSSLF
jgi:DNA protecting protein DprA